MCIRDSSRIARGLQVLQELFVDIPERVAIVAGIEVDAIDLVHHLPHQGAVFHVVVGILKRRADQRRQLVLRRSAQRL